VAAAEVAVAVAEEEEEAGEMEEVEAAVAVPQPGAAAVAPQQLGGDAGAVEMEEEEAAVVPQPGAAAVAVEVEAAVVAAAVAEAEVPQLGGGGAGGSPPARMRKGKGDAEKRRKVVKPPIRGGEGQAAAVEADGMRTVDGVRRETFMSRLHRSEPLRFMGSGDVFRLKAVVDGAPKIDHPKCKGAGGCKGCGCVGRVRAYVDIVPGKVGAEYKAWYRDGGHKEWAALTREFPDYLDIVMEDVQARTGKKKVTAGNNKRTASATANEPPNKKRKRNPKRIRGPPKNRVIYGWMKTR